MIVKINRLLLQKSVNKMGVGQQVQKALVMEEFMSLLEKKMNKNFANQLKPLYIKNQILNLSVMSSVLANEIRLHQEPILKKLNSKYKKTAVKEIRFLT